MKFLIILFSFLVFSSCTRPYEYRPFALVVSDKNYRVVIPENFNLDFYWEWNEIVVSGEKLSSKSTMNFDFVRGLVEKDAFCTTYVYPSQDGPYWNLAFLGERIIFTKDSMVNFECIYGMQNLLRGEYITYSILEQFFYTLFYRRTEVSDEDSAYRVIYWGDSLDLKSDQVYNHRATTQILKFRTISYSDTVYEERQVHEFYLHKSDWVYSLSFRTDTTLLKGYEPLKMDSMFLPLESPKYRALKVSEETLRKVSRPLSEIKKGD